MRIIKPEILGLAPYVVAQDEVPVKLNQNESPWDLPPEIKKEVWSKLSAASWNRYPSGEANQLKTAISEYTGIPPGGIVVGNGSNELIQAVISAAGRAGEGLVTVDPGFSVYPRAAVMQGLKVLSVALRKDYSFDVNALLEAGMQAKLMFLALPNNPTGTTLSLREVEHLSKNFKGLLVVDEAYFEYSGETVCSLIQTRSNVVVLRTFSKALGIAGLRLGYLLARPELSQEIEKAKLPFSLGLVQQLAGEAVLKQKTRILAKAQKVIAERDRMYNALMNLPGLSPVPSRANFLLFKCHGRGGADIFQELLTKGVLVRVFDSPVLSDMLRVTVGTSQENSRFLRVLSSLLKRRRL